MILRSLARKTTNYLRTNQPTTNQSHSVHDLLFQVDPAFQALYNQGIERTGTPPSVDSVVNKQQARYYNLVNIYSLAATLGGNIADIGCWKGLSSYTQQDSVPK